MMEARNGYENPNLTLEILITIRVSIYVNPTFVKDIVYPSLPRLALLTTSSFLSPPHSHTPSQEIVVQNASKATP
jgi:hypothetical protein